jgi:hypothetical protein
VRTRLCTAPDTTYPESPRVRACPELYTYQCVKCRRWAPETYDRDQAEARDCGCKAPLPAGVVRHHLDLSGMRLG